MFTDRKDAAIQLAKRLMKFQNANPLVIGIPRGGAEIAYYVAKELEAEMSLLVSRKLGMPDDPELAFGAIAEDGSVFYNPHSRMVSKEDQELIKSRQKEEIKRRITLLRGGQSLPDMKGRTVIIVDDGIATGATIMASIKMCRVMKAGRIIVAAPVSSREKVKELDQVADEVVILETPHFYYAVSQTYEDFYNLTDEDARSFYERYLAGFNKGSAA